MGNKTWKFINIYKHIISVVGKNNNNLNGGWLTKEKIYRAKFVYLILVFGHNT